MSFLDANILEYTYKYLILSSLLASRLLQGAAVTFVVSYEVRLRLFKRRA